MDAFKDFLPKGKVVECFENLATLTVTELDGARLNNPSYKSFDPRGIADKVS